MFGKPGSLTMYSTALRGGLSEDKDRCAGPADYNVTKGSIQKRKGKMQDNGCKMSVT